MSAVIVIFVAALFFVLIGTPAAQRVAFKLGALTFLLACYGLWQIEWRLSHELRTGKSPKN